MIRKYFSFDIVTSLSMRGGFGKGETLHEAYQQAHRNYRIANRIENQFKWSHFKYATVCMGDVKIAVKKCDDGKFAMKIGAYILKSDLRIIAERIASHFNQDGHMSFAYYYALHTYRRGEIPF